MKLKTNENLATNTKIETKKNASTLSCIMLKTAV